MYDGNLFLEKEKKDSIYSFPIYSKTKNRGPMTEWKSLPDLSDRAIFSFRRNYVPRVALWLCFVSESRNRAKWRDFISRYQNLDRDHSDSPSSEMSSEVSKVPKCVTICDTRPLGRRNSRSDLEEVVREASEYRSLRTGVTIPKRPEVPMELLDRSRGAVKVRASDTLTATKSIEGAKWTGQMFWHGNQNILRRRFVFILLPKIPK